MALLSIENVDARHGLLQAVRSISFQVDEGETVALIGANGAGKTTLLRTIAGAHRGLAGGRIRLAGEDVTRMPAHDRARRGLALVPEGRRLFSAMTVEENLRVAGAAGRSGDWTVDRVFEAFPMLKARRHARCANLSGGEQQATAIGRALVTNPRVLMLDEVSLGLSPLAVDQVYASLGSLMRGAVTVLLVEQDLSRAMSVAGRIICMLEGRIVLAARTGDVTRDQVMDAYFGLGRSAAAEGGRA
jgi:branched-chain amino acid transport system ATP-binding protein